MAKKEKEVEKSDDLDPTKLSKLLIGEFNKSESGKIAWNLASDEDNPTDVKEFISTGCTLLDYIIANRRNGGVPVGKLTEINGEEASGKSLVAAHLIADCQRRGGLAVYIDTENAANPAFLQQIGVDISKMVYLQPGSVEEVGEAIEKTIAMARAKAPTRLILIIWDGIAGTPTKAELEGTYDLNMNLQLEKSKVLSKMMTKLTQVWGKLRICMVFTNQLKTKIGVMYGDPMTTPGGKAVPYHASVRIRLERAGQQADKKTNQVWGVHTRAKIVKSRLGPPLRKCEFDITFASGIDDESSWLPRLHECGEILKKDGWMYLSSFPSGKLQEKGAFEGQDLGVAFQESSWVQMMKEGADVWKENKETKKLEKVRVDVRNHVLNLLEKHMVVRYGEKPKDMVADPESLMDNEAVLEMVQEGT